MNKMLTMVLVTMFVPIAVWAQDAPAPANPTAVELKIAAGSSSGTYEELTKEIQQLVGDTVTLTVVPSKNAPDNLDHLVGNQANIAMLTQDVIFYRSQIDDLTHLKTLVALFPEDVNIIAKADPFVISNGAFGLGKKTATIDSVADMARLPVGCAGGGFITANVMKAQGGVDWDIVRFDSGTQVLSALRDGTIAAALFVGAAPLPNIAGLNGDYKLIAINDSVAERLKASGYKKSSITYTNISPTPVDTISADCLIVTRNYKSPRIIAALLKLRQAIYDHLTDMQEQVGFHKAWQKVDPANKGKWPWFTGTQDVPTDQ